MGQPHGLRHGHTERVALDASTSWVDSLCRADFIRCIARPPAFYSSAMALVHLSVHSGLLFTFLLLSCAEARDPSREQLALSASGVVPPAASFGLQSSTKSNGNVPIVDADKVVVSLRGKFRECYQAGLKVDPEMQGRVVVSASVEPDGNVGATSIASNVGLSTTVISCIADVLQHAQFSSPGGSGSRLQVPVTFRKRQ
jgi:hypothetical protein